MRLLNWDQIKRLALLSSGALIVFAADSRLGHAREWPCTKFTTLPVLIDGCEGERCESGGNKVVKDVTLYSEPDLHSKVIARLKKGQGVQSIAHKTLLKQMGTFVVGKDPEEPESYWAIQELKQYGVQMGDVIFGVQYGGEGVYNHCIGDKLFYLGNAYGLAMQKPLATEAWSFVKSKNGNGWAAGTDWYIALGE
jgi:hypothetical protein